MTYLLKRLNNCFALSQLATWIQTAIIICIYFQDRVDLKLGCNALAFDFLLTNIFKIFGAPDKLEHLFLEVFGKIFNELLRVSLQLWITVSATNSFRVLGKKLYHVKTCLKFQEYKAFVICKISFSIKFNLILFREREVLRDC